MEEFLKFRGLSKDILKSLVVLPRLNLWRDQLGGCNLEEPFVEKVLLLFRLFFSAIFVCFFK